MDFDCHFKFERFDLTTTVCDLAFVMSIAIPVALPTVREVNVRRYLIPSRSDLALVGLVSQG